MSKTQTYETLSISSGFFASSNGDRTYSADNFGSIFEGIITDGIFANMSSTYPYPFLVEKSSDGNFKLKINKGRGWFNRTWINLYSDDVIDITNVKPSSGSVYIAIVITIDKNGKRKNYISAISGEEASSPNIPTWTQPTSDNLYHYPIAYVKLSSSDTKIDSSCIFDARGKTIVDKKTIPKSNRTDYIIAMLETLKADNYISEIYNDYSKWKNTQESNWSTTQSTWHTSLDNNFTSWINDYKSQIQNLGNGGKYLEDTVLLTKGDYTTVTLVKGKWSSSKNSNGYYTATYTFTNITGKIVDGQMVDAQWNPYLVKVVNGLTPGERRAYEQNYRKLCEGYAQTDPKIQNNQIIHEVTFYVIDKPDGDVRIGLRGK